MESVDQWLESCTCKFLLQIKVLVQVQCWGPGCCRPLPFVVFQMLSHCAPNCIFRRHALLGRNGVHGNDSDVLVVPSVTNPLVRSGGPVVHAGLHGILHADATHGVRCFFHMSVVRICSHTTAQHSAAQRSTANPHTAHTHTHRTPSESISVRTQKMSFSWWLAAILTCKSFVVLRKRCERL